MKKILLNILAMSGAFASAHSPFMPHSREMVTFESKTDDLYEENSLAREGFIYVRFSAANENLAQMQAPHPGLGIGYRRLAGSGAVDISISGIGHQETSDRKFYWTAPKASFLYYLSPTGAKSAYLGGGLAWGGMKSAGQKFVGIIPSATLGYEFLHKSSVLGFIELNVSQPAFAVKQKGNFPGLTGELSIGAGF